MKRRILSVALLAAASVAVAGAAYVRLAPMDAAAWNVAPDAALRTGRPNDWLLAPGGDGPAIASPDTPAPLLSRIDAVAMAEPGVIRLAGTPADGLVTYVQRSRLMGYPDAISVQAVPEGAGSLLTIWSRARYGQSDLGVNRARVERWLAAAGI